MTCEHEFAPFPGSRSKVYCRFCGSGRDAFATPPSPAPRRARARAAAPPHQTSLLPDPAREEAAQILARAHLEDALREIVDGTEGLGGEDAQALVDDALAFGPSLDLDRFAEMALARAKAGAPAHDDPF